MRTEGILIQCDYPRCDTQVMLAKTGEGEADGGYTRFNTYEPKPEGWGYVDGKDLCPDHYQEYLDMIQEFWDPIMPYEYAEPPIGKHAPQEIDALAAMLEADNSVVEPELKDEDILHDGSQVIVKGPENVYVGKVKPNDHDEEW